MSKKAYYKCDECGLSFEEEQLVMTDKLDLTCLECIEESKRDKKVRNLTMLVSAGFAFMGLYIIYKLFVK